MGNDIVGSRPSAKRSAACSRDKLPAWTGRHLEEGVTKEAGQDLDVGSVRLGDRLQGEGRIDSDRIEDHRLVEVPDHVAQRSIESPPGRPVGSDDLVQTQVELIDLVGRDRCQQVGLGRKPTVESGLEMPAPAATVDIDNLPGPRRRDRPSGSLEDRFRSGRRPLHGCSALQFHRSV